MDEFFVGIDAGLESFTVTMADSSSSVVRPPQTYLNTVEGIDQMLEQLSTFDRMLFCVENCGVYSELLCYQLHQKGHRVVLADPLHVSRQVREGGHKTDPIDSTRIADYAVGFRHKLSLWSPNEVIVEQVSVLLSTREQLVKQKSASQNLLTTLKRKVVQTPPANKRLAETIDHLRAQIKRIEEDLRDLIRQHPSLAQGVALLLTIRGVGLLLSAHMLVLTKGFTQIPDYARLAAHLGIAPRRYESGKTIRRRPRSRGYGPHMVRKLLHLSARSVATHTEQGSKYYLRKQAEGKPKTLILNNIANKQLRLICAVLNNRIPYSDSYRSINPRLLTTT